MRNIPSLVVALLLLLPTPGNGQFLPVNADYWWFWTDDGVAHYVLDIGTTKEPERTVVVLHGGYGADHSPLVEMVLPLSEDIRFVLYDQRGSLRSPAPDSAITSRRFVEDLDALREALGLDQLRLVAHSNGAKIALDYLGTHPSRVAGLVLVGPPLGFLHSGPFDDDRVALLLEGHPERSEVFNTRVEAQVLAAWDSLALSDPDALTPRERSIRRRVEFAGWNTVDPHGWRDVRNAFFEPRVFDALQENTPSEAGRARMLWMSEAFAGADIPIRVILGSADHVDPHAHVWSGLIDFARCGRLTVLDPAGHMPWVDEPTAFQSALRQALDDLSMSCAPPSDALHP